LRAPLERFADDLREEVAADFAAERFVDFAPVFRLAAGFFFAALERAPEIALWAVRPRADERAVELLEPALRVRDAAGFFAAARFAPVPDEPLRPALFVAEPLREELFAAELLRLAAVLLDSVDAERAAAGRFAAAFFAPRFADVFVAFLARPDPLFLPPPVSLLTVAQARRSASSSETPRLS
jgi:hypothetical protein